MDTSVSVCSNDLGGHAIFVLFAGTNDHGCDESQNKKVPPLGLVSPERMHFTHRSHLGETFNTHAPGSPESEVTLNIVATFLIVRSHVDVCTFVLADAGVGLGVGREVAFDNTG